MVSLWILRILVIGERQAICAVRRVRLLTLTNITAKDHTGNIKNTWFDSPFIKNVLHRGDTYVFVGTVKVKNNMRVMDMPEYYKLSQYEDMRQEMRPIYPFTSGLSK